MSDTRNAALVLKTSDLTVNSTSTVGECNADITIMTWYGVNLRTLLGDMYDDYDLFNLCLNTVVFSYTNTLSFASSEDKSLLINISGLPFINQGYNQSTGHNQNKTVIGGMLLTSGVGNCINFYSNNIALFGKNQETCNITITLTRVLDGAKPITNGATFPQSVFIFDIIGVVQDNLKRNTPKLYLPSYGI